METLLTHNYGTLRYILEGDTDRSDTQHSTSHEISGNELINQLGLASSTFNHHNTMPHQPLINCD